MTTITLSHNSTVRLASNYPTPEALYLALQEQMMFEKNLQEKAHRGMTINEEEIVDFQ
jgi:hypothetical protein